MIIYRDIPQQSEEWFELRRGIPTASEYSSVMAKGRGSEPSKTRQSYLYRLAGEQITGRVEEAFSNKHTERGNTDEPRARGAYAFLTGAEVDQVTFIRSGRTGASPDGLVGEDGMVEIKSKLARLHLALLEARRKGAKGSLVPSEHILQIQGGLWVAEREWTDFVSYSEGLPLFVERVYRDEKKIQEIAKAVDQFNAELDEIVAHYLSDAIAF